MSPACIFSFHVVCCSYHTSSQRSGSNLKGHNTMRWMWSWMCWKWNWNDSRPLPRCKIGLGTVHHIKPQSLTVIAKITIHSLLIVSASVSSSRCQGSNHHIFFFNCTPHEKQRMNLKYSVCCHFRLLSLQNSTASDEHINHHFLKLELNVWKSTSLVGFCHPQKKNAWFIEQEDRTRTNGNSPWWLSSFFH